jgi:hypothetical protein
MKAFVEVAGQLTATAILMLAWYREQKRADRLEALITADWSREKITEQAKEAK